MEPQRWKICSPVRARRLYVRLGHLSNIFQTPIATFTKPPFPICDISERRLRFSWKGTFCVCRCLPLQIFHSPAPLAASLSCWPGTRNPTSVAGPSPSRSDCRRCRCRSSPTRRRHRSGCRIYVYYSTQVSVICFLLWFWRDTKQLKIAMLLSLLMFTHVDHLCE